MIFMFDLEYLFTRDVTALHNDFFYEQSEEKA